MNLFHSAKVAKKRRTRLAPLPDPPTGHEVSLTLPVPGPPEVEARLTRIYRMLLVSSLLSYCVFVLRVHPAYGSRPKRSIALELPIAYLAARQLPYAVHEGMHAALLWAYTGERPLVSLLPPKGGYAYTASPRWYFPRNRYLVVGLTPLVILTPLLLALVPVVPVWLLQWLGWTVVRNVSGSNADLYVAWQLLRRHPNCYIHDTGQVFTFWEPTKHD